MANTSSNRKLDNHETNLQEIERVMQDTLILAQDNLYKTGRIILTVVSGAIVLSFNYYANKLALYDYSWLLIVSWVIGLIVITLFVFLMVNSQRAINLFAGYLIQSRSLIGTILLRIRSGELTEDNLWQSDDYLSLKKITSVDPIKDAARIYDKGYLYIMGLTAAFFLSIIIFAILNSS